MSRAMSIFAFAMSGLLISASSDAADVSPSDAVRKPFGIEKRELWTTNNIHGTPEPPDRFTTRDAFPQLKLFEPLSVGLVPGTNQFGVATRPGKIQTFEIRPDVAKARLILDLERLTYGLVFHPQFATNRQFFVTYIPGGDVPESRGSRLARFELQDGATPEQTLETEKVILEWPTGGHNGGCMRFGPDGYLYLATGDGSGIADGLETGQNINDLLGAILRIDVDHPTNEMAYSIPGDNPFVGRPDTRGEVYSFGHRQVWKFSFDNQRRLWAGEVGQDLWEMVYLIQSGGNYGWSVNEGKHPFRPERAKGPGEFQVPVIEHPHSDFRSLTGGYVWNSDRLPELKGAYIYGDYDTGKLWSFKYENGRVTSHQQLADTQIRIVEFAQDNAGEVYLVDFAGGGFHRIMPAVKVANVKPFPRKLSETGLFASTKDNRPAPGLIPYSVNAPLWSDHAEKERFIALPGDSQIEFDTVVYPHGPAYPDVGWRFPDGAVMVKTFSIDTEVGNPASRKRLETRILQYRKMPGNDDEYGAQFWNGYTYVWNDQQTDADLLDASGLNRKMTIKDANAPGGQREQEWRFPSRAECTLCHTMASKYVLGVTTLQMNKDHDYGGVVANQLATLEHLGIFKDELPNNTSELPRLVDYRDSAAALHLRARSYLHANCAHCHRKWGGGNAEFELQATLPLTETLMLNTKPGQGTFKLNDPRILVPGDPNRSLLLQRMRLDGLGKMPHIASNERDTAAIEMLREWVTSLTDSSLLERPGAIHPRK